ncbi:MAG TPA: hypothetical protein VG013_41360 [Gemmataceae bacterium]|jgi:hypothetical protein|nr:hypothetical protein [Gemmataceae bacterium]
MTDLLSKFDAGELIGLVAVVGGLLCGIMGIFLGVYFQGQRTRRAEIAAALKQDMLNRGMSADEIRTVLDAGAQSPRRAGRQSSVV